MALRGDSSTSVHTSNLMKESRVQPDNIGLYLLIPKKCDAITQERRWSAPNELSIVNSFLFWRRTPNGAAFWGH